MAGSPNSDTVSTLACVVPAMFITARVLGYDLGIARVIGSVVFAIVIGMIMAAAIIVRIQRLIGDRS